MSIPSGDLVALYVHFRDLLYRKIDRLVVVGRCHDEIGLGDAAVVVRPVMMDQRAPRRFDGADALARGLFGLDPEILGHDVVVLQQLERPLGRIEQFDRARHMVIEALVDHAADGLEGLHALAGLGRADRLGHVQPRERADAVDAVGPAFPFIVRELEPGVVLNMLGDVGQVVAAVELVDLLAGRRPS